jgi:hypothetical protein
MFGRSLLRQKHIPRMLERASDRTLMLGRKTGVLTWQDLAGVGHITAHRLRSGEGNFRWRGSLLLLFSGAHARKEGKTVRPRRVLSTCILT